MRDFTLSDVIDRNRRIHGDRLAFVADGVRVTHLEYASRVRHLATGLLGLGLTVGDRVAILARNCLAYVDLYGAVAHLGLILVPINWRLSTDEIAYVIADTAPRVIVVGADYVSLIGGMCQRLASIEHYLSIGTTGEGFDTFESLYRRDANALPADIPAESALMILHTAAVGGRPRGALLSHTGILTAGQQQAICWGLCPQDVNLGALPLFHVSGVGLLIALQQAGGATIVLPEFDATTVIDLIAAEKVTVCATFPPMLGTILDRAFSDGGDLSSLRNLTGVDSPDTISRFESFCPSARFWVAYGQSEVSGPITIAPFRDRPGSVGRPGPLVNVEVVDDLDRPLPAGQTGEIIVRGPMVFNGYWGRNRDSEFTFRNGWHHTGDMGRFDLDGYLWYAGRSPAKELIKSGGENVYPAEVERALLEHPAIAEAAVFGVPDAHWGEAITAVCVLRTGMAVSAAELIEFTSTRIARFKRPKSVVFAPLLPRDPQGMLDRARIKEELGGI
ncbi:MAG: AMP-binding protein [Rhodocyclaceae bacterium]|nr:AMP-binding protein [Rhodocyclaceae bacterium]